MGNTRRRQWLPSILRGPSEGTSSLPKLSSVKVVIISNTWFIMCVINSHNVYINSHCNNYQLIYLVDLVFQMNETLTVYDHINILN